MKITPTSWYSPPPASRCSKVGKGAQAPTPFTHQVKPMTTYEFWTLDGRYLDTLTTDTPEAYFGELSVEYGVPNDEIEFFAVEA